MLKATADSPNPVDFGAALSAFGWSAGGSPNPYEGALNPNNNPEGFDSSLFVSVFGPPNKPGFIYPPFGTPNIVFGASPIFCGLPNPPQAAMPGPNNGFYASPVFGPSPKMVPPSLIKCCASSKFPPGNYFGASLLDFASSYPIGFGAKLFVFAPKRPPPTGAFPVFGAETPNPPPRKSVLGSSPDFYGANPPPADFASAPNPKFPVAGFASAPPLGAPNIPVAGLAPPKSSLKIFWLIVVNILTFVIILILRHI